MSGRTNNDSCQLDACDKIAETLRPIPDVVPRFPYDFNEFIRNESEDPVFPLQPYAVGGQFKHRNGYQNLRSRHRDSYQAYRTRPGSVYGIKVDPRYSATAHFQPNTIRIFTPTASHTRPNAVHIGGILTLPKQTQGMDFNSSQSSSSSSSSAAVNDETLVFALPGMTEFQKMAKTGLRDVEKLISQYNVKSHKGENLLELCSEVNRKLCKGFWLSQSSLQTEPVLRELILGFLHATLSWASLSAVLPSHPGNESVLPPPVIGGHLQPLLADFSAWQETSQTLMEKIIAALVAIPPEYEKYLSGPTEPLRKVKEVEVDQPTNIPERFPPANFDSSTDLQRIQLNPNLPLNCPWLADNYLHSQPFNRFQSGTQNQPNFEFDGLGSTWCSN